MAASDCDQSSRKVIRMHVRKPRFPTLLLMAGVAGGITLLNIAHTYSATDSDFYRKLDLFGEVLEQVRSKYVDKPDDEGAPAKALADAPLICLTPARSFGTSTPRIHQSI